MVKSKGVIKISSKMRSKMERSNKNTRTKTQLHLRIRRIRGPGNWQTTMMWSGFVENTNRETTGLVSNFSIGVGAESRRATLLMRAECA